MEDFKEKSAEEIEKMTAEEKQNYFVSKLKHEKEQMELRLKALEDAKSKDGEDEKLTELEKEVQELKETQFETLKKALKEQGTVITELKKGRVSGEQVQSIETLIKDNIENLKAYKEKGEGFNMEIKAVGDMTFANNVTGTVPQALRLPGVNDIAEDEVRVYSRIPKLRTSGNTIEWVYETAQEGTPGGTSEGSTKNQIDNNFVVTSVALLKQTAYFKVSTEMLDDAQFMNSWLRNKLIIRLMNVIDDQILEGDGTGTNLNGLDTQATAFAAGSLAGTVDQANEVDVLVAAENQIRVANHNGSLTIFMHPTDVAKLKLYKVGASDRRYVNRVAQVGSTLTLDGYPIIPTNKMDVGDYLIGDLSKALIAEKGGVMIEFGLDGNDFTKNMRTIIAEWRGELIIQNNDTTAFVKGDFATDKAALETT